MPTFTIHAPPAQPGETEFDPERFVFVRDGFYFWAFALTPLWLIARGLWLALLGYMTVALVLGGGFYLLGAPMAFKYIGEFLIGLLAGLEAATLWRWTLARRGWRMLGFVVGDDAESAERRFFAEYATRAAAPPLTPPEPRFSIPVRRGPPSGSDVIGLFPEPGDPR